MSPEERQRAAEAAAAAAEAAARAAADDSFGRALEAMMGGALVRPANEVADLAAQRPAWMNGNPQVRGVWQEGGGMCLAEWQPTGT